MKRGLVVLTAVLTVSSAGCVVGLRNGDARPKAETGPSMQIAAPPAHVTGLAIVKADGDTSGATGHFHVFIDRDPVAVGQPIPKEKGIVHSAENPIKLYGLAPGQHRMTVVVGDGAHKRILGSLQKQLTVTVDGPSVTVTGLQLMAANGDTSGKTGHLHLFVDRDPTPAGQPIPKERARTGCGRARRRSWRR
jgi:hypothetical protein